MGAKAARAKRVGKTEVRRTSPLKSAVAKARLAAVIMFTKAGMEVQFKGPWTGRDIQMVQAGFPQKYYAYQNQRLREARAGQTGSDPGVTNGASAAPEESSDAA